MKYVEMREALKDKKLILRSYPKALQSKPEYYVKEILYNPRNLNTAGNPEQLKHTEIEM
jgi:hypothetical protein